MSSKNQSRPSQPSNSYRARPRAGNDSPRPSSSKAPGNERPSTSAAPASTPGRHNKHRRPQHHGKRKEDQTSLSPQRPETIKRPLVVYSPVQPQASIFTRYYEFHTGRKALEWIGNGDSFSFSSSAFNAEAHFVLSEVSPLRPDYNNMKLQITYTSDKTVANKWARDHIINRTKQNHSYPHSNVSLEVLPIGYDSEWKPNYDAGNREIRAPALIQLCVNQKHVLLFQLVGRYNRRIEHPLPDFNIPRIGETRELADLSAVFNSKNYLKLGASIGGDFDLLKLFHGFDIGALKQSSHDLDNIVKAHYSWVINHMFGNEFISSMEKVKRVFNEGKVRNQLIEKFGFPVVELYDPLLASENEIKIRETMEIARLYFQAMQFIDVQTLTLKEGTAEEPTLFRLLRNCDHPICLPISSKNLRCGLAASVERYLKYELQKSKSVTCSNWEAYPLSNNQIQYAALDAWVSECVFHGIVDDITMRCTSEHDRNRAFKHLFPHIKFNHHI